MAANPVVQWQRAGQVGLSSGLLVALLMVTLWTVGSATAQPTAYHAISPLLTLSTSPDCQHAIRLSHKAAVIGIKVSPDGSRLSYGQDGTVRLWDW